MGISILQDILNKNKIKYLCLSVKATKLILKQGRQNHFICNKTSIQLHEKSSLKYFCFNNSQGIHKIYHSFLIDEKIKGNFVVTSVLSNLMVGLTEKQVKILSVYKKAKKNAAKIIWLAGHRESQNLCRTHQTTELF